VFPKTMPLSCSMTRFAHRTCSVALSLFRYPQASLLKQMLRQLVRHGSDKLSLCLICLASDFEKKAKRMSGKR
jgi:hypothetical protein